MPRWLAWIIAIIAVIWIISSPQQAGHDIHDWIASAFSFGESVSS